MRWSASLKSEVELTRCPSPKPVLREIIEVSVCGPQRRPVGGWGTPRRSLPGATPSPRNSLHRPKPDEDIETTRLEEVGIEEPGIMLTVGDEEYQITVQQVR